MESQRQLREQVKAAWAEEQEKLGPVVAQLMAEAEDDWSAKTGRPMPKDLDELLDQAALAGWSPQEVVDGNFTWNDVYRSACAAKKLRDERISDEMTARTAIVADRYQRTADDLHNNARKVLVAMLTNNVVGQGNRLSRTEIARLAGLSESQIKTVMESQIPRAEAALGRKLVKAESSLGTWLTDDGVWVANKIPKNVLS